MIKTKTFSILFLSFLTIAYLLKLDSIIYLILLLINFSFFYFKYKNVKLENSDSLMRMQRKIKLIENENTFNQNTFEQLAKNIESGLLIVKNDKKIEYANKLFEKKILKEQAVDLDIRNIANDVLRELLSKVILLENYSQDLFESDNKYYKIYVTKLYTKNYQDSSLILFSDVTKLKKATQLQKEFVADASHELKTPITAIKLGGESLKYSSNLAKKEKEILDIIIEENNRMQTIVEDLLSISQYDRLDFKLNLSKINLLELINSSLVVLREYVSVKKIEVVNQCSPQIFIGDYLRLKQVMLNILKNAINYNFEGGTVKISNFSSQNELIITVIDTGVGIKEEELQLIFERFYRIDKARNRDTGGTGLGLSIVKKIIKKHNGKIEVESQLDKGTTFKIYLPLKIKEK